MKIETLSHFFAKLHINENMFEAVRLGIYAFMAFFNLNAEWVVILVSFMFIDTFFGLIKAFRMNEKISFKVLMWGITIKLCILCVPFILATMALVFGENLKFVVDMMVRLLIVNECLSILANIISIKTKKNVKNLDLISLALNQIRICFYRFGKTMLDEVVPDSPKTDNDDSANKKL